MTLRNRLLAGVVAIAVGSVGVVAVAAEPTAATEATAAGPGETTLGSVVVTARKQSENLQRVPLAVTAVQGRDLQRQSIRSAADLQQIVPGLIINNTGGAHGITGALWDIRGQEATTNLLTFSSPVGLYEDGVNIPHEAGTNLSLFDISRVEVLKGPQGTLYGRNTSAGAINFFTRNADYAGLHGFVSLEGGSYDDAKVGAAVNVPIIDGVLAVRLAYQYWYREGFGSSWLTQQRLGDPRNDHTFRASVRFDPSPKFTANLKVEYASTVISGELQTAPYIFPSQYGQIRGEWMLEGRPGGVDPVIASINNTNIFSTPDGFRHRDSYSGIHFVADETWHITDNIDLRSITGYHGYLEYRASSVDPMNVMENFVGVGVGHGAVSIPANSLGLSDLRPMLPDQQDGAVSQEFDLSGKMLDDRFHWLVGAYYSTDSGHGSERAAFIPLVFGRDFDSGNVLKYKNDSIAAFTQEDFRFTDWFSITLGGRYTSEKLSQFTVDDQYILASVPNRYVCSAGPVATAFPGVAFPSELDCAFSQSVRSNGLSYLGSLNFQVTPNVLFYLKTSRGFRGAALQSTSFGPPVKPEIAVDYEAGLKGDFLGHRLRVDTDIFDTQYKNKQESANALGPGGGSLITFITTAQAHIRGAEVELSAVPVEHLTVTATGAWLLGTYTSFPNAPNPVPGGPPINVSGTQLVNNPRWNFNVGAHYDLLDLGPGDLGIQVNYAWRDRLPTSPLNNLVPAGVPVFIQDRVRAPVGLLNANLDYTLHNYGVVLSVFVTNLLDKHYQVPALWGGLPAGPTAITQEPRMIGVSVRKSFGQE